MPGLRFLNFARRDSAIHNAHRTIIQFAQSSRLMAGSRFWKLQLSTQAVESYHRLASITSSH